MIKQITVKGKVTKETVKAIDHFGKTGSTSLLEKLGKVIINGSKLILI